MVNGIINYDGHSCLVEVNENGVAVFVGGGTQEDNAIGELLIESPLDIESSVDKLTQTLESGYFGDAIGVIYTTDSIFIIKDEFTAKQVELTDPKSVIKDDIEINIGLLEDL